MLGGLGRLTVRGDYAYRSRYYNDVANSPGLAQQGFGLFNARVSLQSASQQWEVAAFGTNLTDERYITGGVGGIAALGFDEVQYARPREWGMSLTYQF
jgi:iron complex outermembrane receptor protein